MTLTKPRTRSARETEILTEIENQARREAATALSKAHTDDERRRAAKGVGDALADSYMEWFGAHPTACFFGKRGRDVICNTISARARAERALDAVQGRGA